MILTLNSLVPEKEVATQLAISLASLRRWRVEGRGPRYLKLGASVRYRIADVEDWLASRPAGGDGATRGDRAV